MRKIRFLKIAFLLLIYVLSSGCDTEVKDLAKEVDSLNSIALRTAFMDKLYDDDNIVRNDVSNALRNFGIHSEEHKKALAEMKRVDEENARKLSAYLKKYGHPEKDIHGNKAIETPWLISHHAADYETKEENFRYIYQGFLNGDIEGGRLSMFLGGMYEAKFGDRLKFDKPFTEEVEIDTIMKVLDLYSIIKTDFEK